MTVIDLNKTVNQSYIANHFLPAALVRLKLPRPLERNVIVDALKVIVLDQVPWTPMITIALLLELLLVMPIRNVLLHCLKQGRVIELKWTVSHFYNFFIQ